ncbi:hypothetical protein Tco_1463631 [Tanacetum coccineum]
MERDRCQQRGSYPRGTPPLEVGDKLSLLTATQKNLEKPDSKIAAAREKKEQQNLAKVEAKYGGAGGAKGLRKKRKVQKHNESIQSGSEEAPSATPLRQSALEVAKKPTTIAAPAVATSIPHTKREVVDLSRSMRVPTPPVAVNQPSHLLEHHDYHEHATFDAEDEFLGNLSNMEILDNLKSGLQRANQDNDELTKKLTLLNSAHSECLSREKELSDMVEKIWSLEKDLEPRTQKLVAAKEKVGVLEGEKLALLAEVAQVEADRKKLIREFIPTAGWKRSIKSSLLCLTPTFKRLTILVMPMSELLQVSSDVPPPPREGEVSTGAATMSTA